MSFQCPLALKTMLVEGLLDRIQDEMARKKRKVNECKIDPAE